MPNDSDLSATENGALSWALGELGCGPAVSAPPNNMRPFRLGLLRRSRRFGPFTLIGVGREHEFVIASFSNAKAQTFMLKLKLDGARLAVLGFGPLPPDRFRLRDAGPEDIGKIAQIERDSPIELADGRSFRIYRPRLREYLRLQERTFAAVIERDGQPVAARVYAGRTLNLRGGEKIALATSQTARVLPAVRGFNLMSCFGLWMGLIVAPNCDLLIAYVDPGNEIVNAAFRTEESQWTRRALELTFSCIALAGSQYGRAATPRDASRLAELANSAHRREALYGEMDERLFAQKMERAPDVYSWRDVLLSEHAMLGAWVSLDETTDCAPGREPRRRVLSVVLDYGFEGDSGTGELALLLGSHASRAHQLGASHLTLYTYAGGAVAERLAPLAEEQAEVAIQIPLPEPADADGLYTDPLYV